MPFTKGHKDFITKEKRQDKSYRDKLSKSKISRGYDGHGFKKGHKLFSGNKNWLWKGDKASYTALHSWVRRWKGKPTKCEVCGSEGIKKYQWANIDHKYRRVLEDYISMCPSCHKKYDIRLSKKL